MSNTEQILEDVLDKIKDDPGVAGLRDAAQDSGHLSDETLGQYLAGELPPEEIQNVRRHVLFCDTCASLTVARGGEEPEGAGRLVPLADTQPSAPALVPSMTRQRALKVCLVLAAAGLGALILFWFPIGEGSNPETTPRVPLPTRLRVTDANVVTLSSPASTAGAVRPDSEIALKVTTTETPMTQLHAYVLVLLPDGKLRALYPADLAFSQAVALGQTVLPGGTTGWKLPDIAALAAGQTLGFYILVKAERIGLLEDELRAETIRDLQTRVLDRLEVVDDRAFGRLARELETMFDRSAVHLTLVPVAN